MSKRLVVEELATEWRCERRVVLDAIASKELPATKIGGRWLIWPADAEAYEAGKRNVPVPKVRERRPPRKRTKRDAA